MAVINHLNLKYMWWNRRDQLKYRNIEGRVSRYNTSLNSGKEENQIPAIRIQLLLQMVSLTVRL